MKNETLLIKQSSTQLSKEQIKFNKLLNQLTAEQSNLEQLENLADYAEKQHLEKVRPLVIQTIATRKELILNLDKATRNLKFGKKQRENIDQFFFDTAFEMLSAGIEEAREMFDYYNTDDEDFDEIKKMQNEIKSEFFKDMAEEHGVEMPDDIDLDWDDPEAVAAFMHQTMEKEKARIDDEAYEKKKKKSEKQKAKLSKSDLEQVEFESLKRTIYMDLVKRHHPDRYNTEPDKIRAEEAMKRITNANEENNLLELIKLQIELGSSMPEFDAKNMAEKQLKLLNKNLSEKVQALKMESDMLRNDIQTLLQSHWSITTKASVDSEIKKHVQMENRRIKELNEYISDITIPQLAKSITLELLEDYLESQRFRRIF